MDDLVFPLGIVVAILLAFGSLLGVVTVNTYYSNQQKLECIERMMDKNAIDILAVCGKISS